MDLSVLQEPILSGIALGLVLAAMLGPVFFSLVQTSLQEGFRGGFHLALGVLASDAFIIFFCYFFASMFSIIESHHPAMNWAGGIILIVFGIYTFLHRIPSKEMEDRKAVHTKFMLKGFLLNLSNPAVLFFWLGVIGLVGAKHYTRAQAAAFFGSALATVFVMDLMKAQAAHWLKKILRPPVMIWLNRLVGLALIGFGLSLMIN
jgi:threonine/homoserine/homoserine lactone efflux protein